MYVWIFTVVVIPARPSRLLVYCGHCGTTPCPDCYVPVVLPTHTDGRGPRCRWTFTHVSVDCHTFFHTFASSPHDFFTNYQLAFWTHTCLSCVYLILDNVLVCLPAYPPPLLRCFIYHLIATTYTLTARQTFLQSAGFLPVPAYLPTITLVLF